VDEPTRGNNILDLAFVSDDPITILTLGWGFIFIQHNSACTLVSMSVGFT
jgi:hypothetical protein